MTKTRYIVLSKTPDGNPSYNPFEDFREAQTFAKAEAKRLLVYGRAVIFEPTRSYSATIEIKEDEQQL